VLVAIGSALYPPIANTLIFILIGAGAPLAAERAVRLQEAR